MEKALYITNISAKELKQLSHDCNRVPMARFHQIQHCINNFTEHGFYHIHRVVGIQLAHCEEPVAQLGDRIIAQQPYKGEQMRIIGGEVALMKLKSHARRAPSPRHIR